MISEAKAFWDSISGKVKSLIRKETENAMRLQRYDVTTAPNGTVMGVTEPFGGNEVFLPYSAEVARATVGDSVLVAWWGSMSNAKVYFFSNGYESGGIPPGGEAGQELVKAPGFGLDWATKPYGSQTNVLSGAHDFNNYTTAGLYYFGTGATLSNQPNGAVNGWLTVFVSGVSSDHIKQIWVRQGSNPYTFRDYYMRYKDGDGWGAWYSITPGENKVLWTGGSYMTESQDISFSEPVSQQKTGVVFAWSYYTGGASKDYDWHYFFVPKWHILNHGGTGVDMLLVTANSMATKYLYVYDTHCKGYAQNSLTRTNTGAGVTMNNANWVLRAVIGV